MNYLYTRKERLLLEARIIFSDDFAEGLIDVFGSSANLLRVREVDSKKLKKDEYTLSFGSKPNMVKIDDKTEIKFGRLLSILTPNTPDHIKSDMVNKWKAYFDFENRGEFKLVDSSIDDYYDCDRYAESKGTLGSSCLRFSTSEIFQIYEDNDSIKLLVLLNEDEEVLARSIVFFDTNVGSPVMNRIYTIDETDENTFKMYAKKEGWKFIDDIDITELEIYIEESDFEHYPYVDNVPYLNKSRNILTSVDVCRKWLNDSEHKDDVIIKLEDHEDGYWTPIQNGETPAKDWESRVGGWEDVQYCISPYEVINFGIEFTSFRNEYMEDDIEQRTNIEDFKSYYEGDTLIEYLHSSWKRAIDRENDNTLIYENDPKGWVEFALENKYDYKYYLFEEQDFNVEEINEILTHLFEWNEGHKKPKTREEQEKIIDHSDPTKLVLSVIELNYLNLDDIKDYIKDNYVEILSDNYNYDLRVEVVRWDIRRIYSNYYEPSDILEDIYGRINDLTELRSLLDAEWDRDRFIQSVIDNNMEDQLISCMFDTF